MSIEDFPLDSSSADLLQAGMKALDAGNYALARTKMTAIYEQHPNFSVPVMYIGRAYFREGMYSEAEVSLKKALAANFHNYLAHWFMADLLAARKKLPEAAKEMAIAWTLNRNDKVLEKATQDLFRAAKLKFQPFDFYPELFIVNRRKRSAYAVFGRMDDVCDLQGDMEI